MKLPTACPRTIVRAAAAALSLTVSSPAFAGAHDLTPSGGVTYSASSPKFGADNFTGLAGGASSLSLGPGVSIGIYSPTAWAIEAWIRTSGIQSIGQVAAELDTSDYIGINTASNYADAVVGGVAITTTKTVTDGAWHHLALSCGAATCNLYVDGALAGSAAAPTSFLPPNVTVGLYGDGSHPIVGDVDEVAFWSTNKYPAAFTPPSAAYAGTEGMTALYHLDATGVDSAVVVASTAYSLSAPARAFGVINAPSQAFTVATNGSNAAGFTITPTDENGCTSCFSPSPLAVAASSGATSTATFSYTPTVAGSHTISATNTAGLTNGAPVAYVAQAPSNPLASSSNPLTAAGAITYSTAATGFGQQLATGYATTSAIVPYGSASIEARVSRNGAPTSNKVAIGEAGFGFIGVNSTGDAISACGASSTMTSSKVITDNASHKVRLDMGASGCTLYVDGVSAATTSTAYAPTAAATGFAVGDFGGSAGGAYTWGGTVDEVAVWSTTKGATVASAPYVGTEASLVALYHLDGTLADSATAEITTWSQVSDYTPTGGPQPAGNAPGVAQAGGWYDVHGGIWSLNASSQLVSTFPTPSYNLAELSRPAAEKSVDGQVQVKYVQSSVASTSVTATEAYFRWSNAGSAATGYALNCGGGASGASALSVAKVIAGVPTGFGPATAFTPAGGETCRASVVQVNASTTKLNVSAYASDGTLLATTGNVFDNTPQLQNLSGGIAVYQYNTATPAGSNAIGELTTYTDVATAATGYAISQSQTTGPQGVASTTFDVAANGVLASPVTITPSDGAGGAFIPASVALSGTASALFTYTPASVATQTLTATNSGTLSNPASLSYVATIPPITLGVSSSACHFSRANWTGDTGRAGSVYRRAWNAGAYVTCVWTASANPTATLLVLNNASSQAVVSYVLNGVLNDGAGAGIGASGNVAISGIAPNAVNTLTVYLRSTGTGHQWAGAGNQLQVLGFQIDANSGSAPGVAPIPTKWVLLPGDSTTVGFRADAGVDNNLHDFMFLVGQQLLAQGYDYSVSGASGEGWIYPGSDAVPPYYDCTGAPCTGANYSEANSRWDKIDAGVSILDGAGQISGTGATGDPPALIYVNLLINDPAHGVSVSLVQASITAWLAAVRPAAPLAKIVVLVPPCLYSTAYQSGTGNAFIAALKAAVVASGDPNVFVEDDGLAFGELLYNTPTGLPSSYVWTDETHPVALGHALIAPRAAAKIQSILHPAAAAQFHRSFQ